MSLRIYLVCAIDIFKPPYCKITNHEDAIFQNVVDAFYSFSFVLF